MSDPDEAPSDLLRERSSESRTMLWFVMVAPRWLVTGALAGFVLVVLVGTGLLLPTARSAIREGDSVDTLFQALLTATITGVTLVLTLNQLVLSQEFGALGDQRDRMAGAIQFRQDVAGLVDIPVSPAQPSRFLHALVQATGEYARDLQNAVVGESEEVETAVARLSADVIENAARVSDELDGTQFGNFGVISAALNFEYSWKIFAARRLENQHGDTLSDDASSALSRLLEALELYGPAREHFKTLYFQRELINLSRYIIVTSLPALLVSAGMIAFFDVDAYRVTVLGVDTLAVVVAAMVTVSLVPFLLLCAYILRIGSVTKHTLSMGPFVLMETDAGVYDDGGQ